MINKQGRAKCTARRRKHDTPVRNVIIQRFAVDPVLTQFTFTANLFYTYFNIIIPSMFMYYKYKYNIQ